MCIESSRPSPVEDRIKQLESSVARLKSLLPSTAGSAESTSSQNAAMFFASHPPARNLNLDIDQITISEENRASSSSARPSRFEELDPVATDREKSPSLPFSLAPNRSTVIAESFGTKETTRPVVRLQNCGKGKCFLPPAHECVALLTEYLRDFNSNVPLFHPETIYNHVRDCYSGAAEKTPLSLVLTYTALGIAHRLRVMSPIASTKDIFNAEYYLNRCISVLPDLLLQEPSLPLIQALLGVSILLQTSSRARKAALFVSTAMNMAQHLGHNEAVPDTDGNSSGNKQGFYVFWIAFFLDTSLSLRALRPNTQKLIDISAPLPGSTSGDLWASNTSDHGMMQGKGNLFALHASLAVIQAEALEDLFSVKAHRQPTDLVANDFRRILAKLDVWSAMPTPDST